MGDIICVEAGNDVSLCPYGTLDISGLMAQITGDVSDGMWFTLGDGKFLPGNVDKLRFSQAMTYVPGYNDVTTGSIQLLLVSDDPDNDGPRTEVTDSVRINFQTSPTLICNTSFNLSLNADCEQYITPQMVLFNPDPPYDRYSIELRDSRNQIIPDNRLTAEHVGMEIKVLATHECANFNSCESTIKILDKSPPKIYCTSDTLACSSDISPDSIGFPVHGDVDFVKVGDRMYTSDNLDGCSAATLSYQDTEIKRACTSSIDRVIQRQWIATDTYNNSITCIQEIYLRRDSIQGVLMPLNFDGISHEMLDCKDVFPTTEAGYPSPEFTGFPEISSCSNLEATYDDTRFDRCGAGYKVLRRWLLIDWCTSEDFNHNQIIKVDDTLAPEIVCPEDFTVNSDGYECYASRVESPLPLSVTDCSSFIISFALVNIFDEVIQNNESGVFSQVEVGEYTIIYTATDDCGNYDTCGIKLTVIDNQAPTAVCDQFTSIALTEDGYGRLNAESVDDLSHDNCGIAKMEVMKMDPICEANQGRGPYVEFCCMEAGTTVMVAFIVTDVHDNENTCMVSIEIEDKIEPRIYCPQDITVSCRTDFDFEDLSLFGIVVLDIDNRSDIIINDAFNSGVIGKDGWVEDNCSVSVESSFTENLKCNQGLIIRTFTATDLSDNGKSCEQRITISDENPFEYTDLNWPSDYYDAVCVDTAVTPDISGTPSADNTHCADIAFTHVDQIFPRAEGACMKVIRRWTAIDWCQFDSETGYGKWDYDQILKFDNKIAPEILGCIDSTLCLFDADCSVERYVYTILSQDDCTQDQDIRYSWKIDSDKDGSYEYTGSSDEIDVLLTKGIHVVEILIEDLCGNTSECIYEISVIDCKRPTPHCISSVTTVLMEVSNSVTIWASDFDFGSADNCTSKEDLVFSFSQDTSDHFRTITCDSLQDGISEDLYYNMYVTDEAGNQQYCSVSVTVYDNKDNCEDLIQLSSISGNIITDNGLPIASGIIRFHAVIPDNTSVENIDSDGAYKIEDLETEMAGTLLPEKNNFADEGVNTLDIVLIQRHILGKKYFDNPYKLMAADANGSGKLTGVDIVIIRKVILGIIDDFPKGLPSWRFIDAELSVNESNVFSIGDGKYFSQLQKGENKVDFVAVKRGDVDFSWSGLQRRDISKRGGEDVALTYNIFKNKVTEISFVMEDWMDDINGIQVEIEIPNGLNLKNVTSELPGFSEGNYFITDHSVRISWDGSVDLSNDDVLFKLIGTGTLSEPLVIKDGFLKPALYASLNPYNLTIQKGDEKTYDGAISLKILQNPVIDDCRITFTSSSNDEVLISLFDLTGRQLFHKIFPSSTEITELVIPGNFFPDAGTYFVNFKSGNDQKSTKIVKVK